MQYQGIITEIVEHRTRLLVCIVKVKYTSVKSTLSVIDSAVGNSDSRIAFQFTHGIITASIPRTNGDWQRL